MVARDPKEAASILWQNGIVAAWYSRPSQMEIYQFLHEHRFPFLEAGRRWGKTTTILIYVLEKLRANPGWVCRWVTPEKQQGKKIVSEEIDKLQADCPEHLRFKWRSEGSVYLGPIVNGQRSKLYIYGVDKDKGKNLRGETSHIVVGDEFGFWSDPSVLNRVLRPTTLTTRGQIIVCSTPAEDLNHPYYKMKDRAKRLGRFRQKTIYDNESLTHEQIQEEMEEAGGADSLVWRREYLCEEVGDPELLVIPEWRDEKNIVEDDYPRPAHFDAYVSIDSGADDNTSITFGYYDFLNDEDVIEAELVTNGQTTENIIAEAKRIEAELWGKMRPYLRTYEGDKQLLLDVIGTHKYAVVAPKKNDHKAALNQYRIRVGRGKVKIKRRCEYHVKCHKYGRWKDKRHSDFERTEDLGHLDPIASSLYFSRSILRSKNPYPQNEGVSSATHWINPTTSSVDSDSAALQEALNPFTHELEAIPDGQLEGLDLGF